MHANAVISFLSIFLVACVQSSEIVPERVAMGSVSSDYKRSALRMNLHQATHRGSLRKAPDSHQNVLSERSLTATSSDEDLLIVDTDAGADDGFAILALLAAEKYKLPQLKRSKVIAITCVTGNTGVNNVSTNVLATLDFAGRPDIPVYKGATQALVVSPATDYYYGEDGFGDFLNRTANYGAAQKESAVLALIRFATMYPGKISVVCIGPLTNIALAIRMDPSFLTKVKQLYILGGVAHGLGNTEPGVEFNVYMDAEAADIVFENVNMTYAKFGKLLTWDAAVAVNVSQDWRLSVLGKINNPQIQYMNLAERFSFSPNTTEWSPSDLFLACVVLQPSLTEPRSPVRIGVALSEGFARAATLVDYGNLTGLPANVILQEGLSKEGFESMMLQLFPNTTCAVSKNQKSVSKTKRTIHKLKRSVSIAL